MNQKMFYVYVYTDPRNNLPIYVGKGTGDRYRSHLSGSHNPYLNSKIDKIRSEGLQPLVDIVFESESEQLAYDHEELLISKYGTKYDENGILCNLERGGTGGNSIIPSEELLKDLGNMPDYAVADKYNVSHGYVTNTRHRRGIEPYTKKKVSSVVDSETGIVYTGITSYLADCAGCSVTMMHDLVNGLRRSCKGFVRLGDEGYKPPARNINASYRIYDTKSRVYVKGTIDEIVDQCDLDRNAVRRLVTDSCKSSFGMVRVNFCESPESTIKTKTVANQQYSIRNRKTGEVFSGTRIQMSEHISASTGQLSGLFSGKAKSVKGWVVEDSS